MDAVTAFASSHVGLIVLLATLATVCVLAVVLIVVTHKYRLRISWRTGSVHIEPPPKR